MTFINEIRQRTDASRITIESNDPLRFMVRLFFDKEGVIMDIYFDEIEMMSSGWSLVDCLSQQVKNMWRERKEKGL